MIRIIALREIKNTVREKSFWLLSLILFLLFAIALMSSATQEQKLHTERMNAQQLSRLNWEDQNPKNPHNATHFGNFAFRPKAPLSLFDKGLDTYTGSQVFLEPHKQDDFKFTAAEDAGTALRFGELTPAFILQSLLPLLIIFMCFSAVSKEREDNTLKLLTGNGATLPRIVSGKIIGYWLLVSGLIVFLSLLTLFFIPFEENRDTAYRFLWILLIYILYSGIIITICVVLSAFSKTGRASLMKLLSLWMLAVIILPKISSNLGSTLYSSPSQFAYASLVQQDVENGLDGHNPEDKRRDALLARTLNEYNVKSIEDLPVNFDAITMIESEKYTTAVYRKRIAEIRKIFEEQNRISLLASFINPFQAITFGSMAISGTDYRHFTHFQDAAEDYRLYFVNTMNVFMATHTATGDWGTKFGGDTYQIVEAFRYKAPGLSWSLKGQPVAFIALFFWGILCLLLILSTRKINIV